MHGTLRNKSREPETQVCESSTATKKASGTGSELVQTAGVEATGGTRGSCRGPKRGRNKTMVQIRFFDISIQSAVFHSAKCWRSRIVVIWTCYQEEIRVLSQQHRHQSLLGFEGHGHKNSKKPFG